MTDLLTKLQHASIAAGASPVRVDLRIVPEGIIVCAWDSGPGTTYRVLVTWQQVVTGKEYLLVAIREAERRLAQGDVG